MMEIINHIESVLDDCTEAKGYSMDSVAPLDITIREAVKIIEVLRKAENLCESDCYWISEVTNNA